MPRRVSIVSFVVAIILFAEACSYAPGRRIPRSDITLPRSSSDQILGALLAGCANGVRLSGNAPPDSARLAKACAAIQLTAPRGLIDTIDHGRGKWP
jgi:hypothetical protein